MKQLFEEYGDTIIQVIGGVGIFALLIDLISSDGVLHNLIVKILENAC